MHRLKDLFLENWYLKLFSLVLAIGLWAMISKESTSEVFIEVPVEYQNVPPKTEVIGATARTVEVRLRGPSTLVREIAATDVRTVIDLGQLPQDGEKTIPLNAQNVHAPFGVEVVLVTPSSLQVSLEPTVSVTLHILPETTGHLPAGYEIEAIAFKPPDVTAEGPASHVRSQVNVKTTPIDLAGKKATFTQNVNLDLPDPLVRFPEATPVRAQVKIRRKP